MDINVQTGTFLDLKMPNTSSLVYVGVLRWRTHGQTWMRTAVSCFSTTAWKRRSKFSRPAHSYSDRFKGPKDSWNVSLERILWFLFVVSFAEIVIWPSHPWSCSRSCSNPSYLSSADDMMLWLQYLRTICNAIVTRAFEICSWVKFYSDSHRGKTVQEYFLSVHVELGSTFTQIFWTPSFTGSQVGHASQCGGCGLNGLLTLTLAAKCLQLLHSVIWSL